ncbi:hypothetical protein [Urechidicola croceus]|uniref:Lipoprotein n=1 Tax=Urechidicola croceus TaxID=1850246 RepID=A0A1D8P5N2_9FLAO|nr:hypothetical protein [Urechidicola croceus]AOW19860.1 hypothetical protein LPB138_03790 [Urechidicola croceus]
MKKLILFTLMIPFIISCAGKKQMENALYNGNYDKVITQALKKLDNNKDKKRKEDFILMLEEAYYKSVEQDLKTIGHLKKDGNSEYYKEIFDIYLNLDARQDAIKPILPLKVGNRTIKITFTDYSDEIIEYKSKVSQIMYEKGMALLNSNYKLDNRDAYNTFSYIESINPNYSDVRNLMNEAHYKGTDFIIVSIQNQTNQIIPRRLENELLNFDTYGLNDFWTEYHTSTENNIQYDYAMELQLKRINVSPQRVNDKEYTREKKIVDGWKYAKDRNGNIKKDSLDQNIKVDKIITVRSKVHKITQMKSSKIFGQVVMINLNTNKIIEKFPLESGFVFENIYATYRGDKRALTNNDLNLLQGRRIHFPSNEEMVYDTGEDLKNKLKHIIDSFKFS